MQNSAPQNNNQNADKLQNVISDDLFPNVEHISDVKQVIEVMKENSQNITQDQMKALIKLKELGTNTYLHGDENPYKELYDYITKKGKQDVANPEYYLDTIEALIPKPPKPVVMTEGAKGAKK